MAPSPLEKRTTMVSTGRLPSSRLLELSTSRPFVHQVDIVFPFDRELQAAFSKFETDYYTSRASLAEIYGSLRTYGQEPGLEKDAQVASTGSFLPDAWSCWEGSVILNTEKETFESLGLPGVKLSARTGMHGAPEQHLINLSLNTRGANIRSHDFILDSFKRWDRSREESGEGQWDFAFHVSQPDKGTGPLSPSRAQRHEVKPVVQSLHNVRIPTSVLSPRPNARSTSTGRKGRRDLSHGERSTDANDDDAIQDWNERTSSLFEWVGMVNSGAQRLQANDRVDPYVSVYSPPAPCTIGDMVHIRWQGFLAPQFVQRIIDTATTPLPRRVSTAPDIAFIGLTIHGSPWVPVLTPHRIPRLEGEDTASIILAPEGAGNAMTGECASANNKDSLAGRWVMVESIGKWDSRFG